MPTSFDDIARQLSPADTGAPPPMPEGPVSSPMTRQSTNLQTRQGDGNTNPFTDRMNAEQKPNPETVEGVHRPVVDGWTKEEWQTLKLDWMLPAPSATTTTTNHGGDSCYNKCYQQKLEREEKCKIFRRTPRKLQRKLLN